MEVDVQDWRHALPRHMLNLGQIEVRALMLPLVTQGNS